jgi:hypothetical protein
LARKIDRGIAHKKKHGHDRAFEKPSLAYISLAYISLAYIQ